MFSNFFRDGGFGMYPTAIFGFLLVAASVLFLVRPERRFVGLVLCLGAAAFGSGLLGCATGLINTFRYIGHVPLAEQVHIAAIGCAESLNNLVLALLLVVPSALIAAVGALRGTVARTGATAST